MTPLAVEGIGVRLLGIYFIISGSRELIAGILLLWKREQIAGALSRGWRVIRSRDDDEVT